MVRRGYSPADRLACIQLLKTKKFRSKFRSDLCAQLKTWLEEERYPHPLSPKQWDKLVNKYVVWRAAQLETALNRDRSYYGVPRENLEVKVLVENLKTRA